jgi:hypothetical protein
MTAVNSRGDRYGDIGNTVRVLFRWWRRDTKERAATVDRVRFELRLLDGLLRSFGGTLPDDPRDGLAREDHRAAAPMKVSDGPLRAQPSRGNRLP